MYSGTSEILGRYWRAYGGMHALWRSPYFHFAAVGLVLTSNFWINEKWWSQVINVVPNLLGFTLGGFAVFLGFGDDKFRELLAEPDEDAPNDPSLYVKLCATFVHFILVQSIALGCAILAHSWDYYYPWPEVIRTSILPVARYLGALLGYGVFLYAVTSVMAATLHVFRIAIFYEDHQRAKAKRSS